MWWLRCSGMNHHQLGMEWSWLLERQVAVSWKNKLWRSRHPAHIWVKGTQMHILPRTGEHYGGRHMHTYGSESFAKRMEGRNRLQWNTLNCTWSRIVTTNVPFQSTTPPQIILRASSCHTEEQIAPDGNLHVGEPCLVSVVGETPYPSL